jgi:acetoin utilization deacetylase AcuC-like enzyme
MKSGRPRSTGVFLDPCFLDHRPADGHPEAPDRLSVFQRRFTPCDGLRLLAARRAAVEEITSIHSRDHLERIAATAGRPFTRLTADTHASPGSFQAALAAAGAMVDAVSQVVRGELRNAFVLARPPGHHAETDRAMGYCLFNTVAIAAAFARRHLGIRRILVVDWDVHHGNGTQHIFETDPSVLFFSIHQHPLFPGSGAFTETGRGRGEGFSVNLPLAPGHGDADYLALFERLLHPLAGEFAPEVILVSAGFDAHRLDPLGRMQMSAEGFAALTRSLMQLAVSCCGGRLALCLEGGYHPQALAESIEAVLAALAQQPPRQGERLHPAPLSRRAERVVHRCRQVHQGRWRALR